MKDLQFNKPSKHVFVYYIHTYRNIAISSHCYWVQPHAIYADVCTIDLVSLLEPHTTINSVLVMG